MSESDRRHNLTSVQVNTWRMLISGVYIPVASSTPASCPQPSGPDQTHALLHAGSSLRPTPHPVLAHTIPPPSSLRYPTENTPPPRVESISAFQLLRVSVKDLAVGNFSTSTKPRSRAASWPIFTPLRKK